MGFISKEEPIVLNIMLTTKGREKLSNGALNFKYYALGDSEIDYNHNRNVSLLSNQCKILKPADKNPNIISFIKKTYSGSTFNDLGTVTSLTYEAINDVDPIGFFVDDSYIIESSHVKQPDLYVEMSTLSGGTGLQLKAGPLWGRSLYEPQVNDLLYVKWCTSGSTQTDLVVKEKPYRNLVYKITKISGSIGTNDLSVSVDRALPDYSGYALTGTSGCFIYPYSLILDQNMSTDYLSESVIAFKDNYVCGLEKFPFWNMSIIYTEELLGIETIDKKYTSFTTNELGGFVSYIQNQNPYYKKLGVIHYSNNSPANTYGEEFYLNTPQIEIPTIMWHKNPTQELGVTLSAVGDLKMITNSTTGTTSLDLEYYDLGDLNGNIVGKIFNTLKLFVIEDQELLFAMSYKSNRSWTLPDFVIGNTNSVLCPSPVVPPTTPTIYDIIENSCDNITISWSQSIGVGLPIKYIVYRKDDINDTWSIISDNYSTTGITQSGLIDGRTYYYKVMAYDVYGVISNESNVVEYTVSCYNIPTTPVMVDIQLYNDEYNKFIISWSTSESVNTPISYTLLRKTTSQTDWSIIADTIDETYYYDEGLTVEITYQYKVCATDVNSVPSDFSNIKSRKVNNPT